VPFPWLRVFDALLGVGNLALARRLGRRADEESTDERSMERRGAAAHSLEARLANVVVAALKEVFDRDARRIEFERQQAEAEQLRAERLLRLELFRQAGERELSRLRSLMAVTVAAAVGALLVSVQLIGRPLGARVAMGFAWLLILAAMAATFVGQSTVSQELVQYDPGRHSVFHPTVASLLAGWLIVAGLAFVAAAMLVG
jgi:hypothetical protein